MSDNRYVFDLSEGDASMKSLLGGKGAGVAEMNRLGVPVPDAFTVTTVACVETMKRGGEWPEGLAEQVEAGLKRLEERTGRTLGASEKPLLLSVRSGAVVSMPGMMDTILNLGISDESVKARRRRGGQRTLRLRLLPPLHPDVRRGRRGHPVARLRGCAHRA